MQLPTLNVQCVMFGNELMGWGGGWEWEQHQRESEISGHRRSCAITMVLLWGNCKGQGYCLGTALWGPRARGGVGGLPSTTHPHLQSSTTNQPDKPNSADQTNAYEGKVISRKSTLMGTGCCLAEAVPTYVIHWAFVSWWFKVFLIFTPPELFDLIVIIIVNRWHGHEWLCVLSQHGNEIVWMGGSSPFHLGRIGSNCLSEREDS